MQNKQVTERWSSRVGFILATAGAAIGLGNIWRFPYMAGTEGGSAFVIVYILCVLLVGIPIVFAEMSIGRFAKKNPVSALRELAIANKHSKHWRLVGALGAVTALVILSFYSVIGGFSIYYLLQAFKGAFQHASPQQIEGIWTTLLASPLQTTLWHTVFMALTVMVIACGVVKGIERATKIMMPALFAILLFLVIYACTHGEALHAFHFLFDFKISQITPGIIISGLGHAFFSLAVGVGALLIYAAYTPDNSNNMVSSVFIVVLLDVCVAFVSGMAIFPLVFKFHIPLSSGPGLMYEALPITFSHLFGGQWVAALFFLLLLFAAWTSSINLAEPVISVLTDWLKLTRKKAAIIVGAVAWFLGLFSALSFNMFSHFSLLGTDLFGLISNLATNILCPLGGIGFCLFAGWIMSKKNNETSLSTHPFIFQIWYVLIRFLAPTAIVTIFISAL